MIIERFVREMGGSLRRCAFSLLGMTIDDAGCMCIPWRDEKRSTGTYHLKCGLHFAENGTRHKESSTEQETPNTHTHPPT